MTDKGEATQDPTGPVSDVLTAHVHRLIVETRWSDPVEDCQKCIDRDAALATAQRELRDVRGLSESRAGLEVELARTKAELRGAYGGQELIGRACDEAEATAAGLEVKLAAAREENERLMTWPRADAENVELRRQIEDLVANRNQWADSASQAEARAERAEAALERYREALCWVAELDDPEGPHSKGQPTHHLVSSIAAFARAALASLGEATPETDAGNECMACGKPAAWLLVGEGGDFVLCDPCFQPRPDHARTNWQRLADRPAESAAHPEGGELRPEEQP